MILKQLHIINFKSIRSASLSMSSKVNCFVGLNGMGKTNLLDAIHYLSFTKSHLGLPDTFAVCKGENTSILDATFEDQSRETYSILLQIKPGERKILKKNKKEYTRLSEHIGWIPLVIISPQDNQLIIGGSEGRRRFIDQQLSQQDTLYMSSAIQYNRLIEQRNHLLKGEELAPEILDIIDFQLAKHARYIYKKRCDFITQFNPIFNKYYHWIDQGHEIVDLRYQSGLHRTEGDLLPLLQESLQKDIALKYTTEGIHKDDLEMTLDGELVRKIGSQGQTKTFLLSLKLSQYCLLDQDTRTKPILLLDDIFDRLDSQRVERIISLVAGNDFGQIFITDTNREHLDDIVNALGTDYHIFDVSEGTFTPITT